MTQTSTLKVFINIYGLSLILGVSIIGKSMPNPTSSEVGMSAAKAQVTPSTGPLWTGGLTDCVAFTFIYKDPDSGEEQRAMIHSVSEHSTSNLTNSEFKNILTNPPLNAPNLLATKVGDTSGKNFAWSVGTILKKMPNPENLTIVVYKNRQGAPLPSDISTDVNQIKEWANAFYPKKQTNIPINVAACTANSPTLLSLPNQNFLPAKPQEVFSAQPSIFMTDMANPLSGKQISAFEMKALLLESLNKYKWSVANLGTYSDEKFSQLNTRYEANRGNRSNAELADRLELLIQKINSKTTPVELREIKAEITRIQKLAKPGKFTTFLKNATDIISKKEFFPSPQILKEKTSQIPFDQIKNDTLKLIDLRIKQLTAENKGLGAITGTKSKKIEALTKLKKTIASHENAESIHSTLTESLQTQKSLLAEGRTGNLLNRLKTVLNVYQKNHPSPSNLKDDSSSFNIGRP